MSLDIAQFRRFIVEPTLRHLGTYRAGLNSEAAVQLVIATALAESGLKYIDQIDAADKPGPAYGFWQMERATHDDIWRNYLAGRDELIGKLMDYAVSGIDLVDQMQGNAYYACAMCRIHYWRSPIPLPEAGDIEGMAEMWKRVYNSVLGKGTIAGFKAKTRDLFLLLVP